MKNKCKKCFGCNKLEDESFNGTEECENYIKANDYKFIIIGLVIEIMAFIGLLIFIYCEINKLCGG